MFQLKNLLPKCLRRESQPRNLFRYFDGKRMRSADPIQAHIDFDLHPDFNWENGSLLEAGDVTATQQAAKAACDVFGLKPWDPETQTGLTISELIGTIENFLEYCEALKKNINAGLTSPPPTEPSSLPPAVEAPSTTTS